MTEKTIAIYARAYGPRANNSLIVQTDACRRLARKLGCADPEYFLEPGASGCGNGRALDHLLTACTKRSFDAVVATSRDRVTRDSAKLDGFLALMAKSGVAVYFVCEDSGILTDPI